MKNEAGYSLVEVMVSIIILAIGILPLVAMFDMGLNSATAGSNYDKARALANLKMEEAKSVTFDTLRDNFPEGVGTPSASDPDTEPGFPNSMTYVVEKQYMAQPSQNPGPSENWGTCQTNGTCDPGTNLIRVTVTVQWDGNEYTTHGLVAGS